eukprot:PITA_21801
MPFYLTNAPATFHSCMNHIFHSHLRKFVLVFFDDILIYNKTWEEHLQHIEKVLCILEEQQFYAKLPNLKLFLEQKQLQERQQKWINKIQAYDFDIEYVKGKNNVVADALSRRPATLSLMSLDIDWRARIILEYYKDRFACEVLDGQVLDDRYRVVDEIIYYRDRIFLIEGSQLKKKVLQASHDSQLAGHKGFTKTYRAIRERFSWKGLKEDVLQHV